MKTLARTHASWRSRLVSARDPERFWTSRLVHVRHGRHGLGEQYRVVLRHPKDRDLESVFRRGRVMQRLPLSMRKAAGGEDETQPLPENGRWITVHPNGDDEEGHPVFIVPNPDGSHTIVRGAGGALNGLRLDHIKSEEEYTQISKQRREAKIQQQKQVEAARKEQMGQDEYRRDREEREAARVEAARAQQHAEWQFVQTVAKAQGIDPAAMEVPSEQLEGVSERIAERVQERNRDAWISWANRVGQRVKEVVHDTYEGLTQDVLGEIAPDDLVTVGTGDLGRGYMAHMDAMAAERGLTPKGKADIRANVSWRGFLERSELDVTEAVRRQEGVRALHAGAAASHAEVKEVEQDAASLGAGPQAAKEAEVTPHVETLGEAVTILKAMKQAEAARRAAMAYSRQVQEVEHASRLPKASVVVGHELSDDEARDAVARSLSEEHMERAVRPLVQRTNVLEATTGSMREHYSVGQTASFGAVAQAVDGSTVDPIVVDVLGPAGAAAAMAAVWRGRMSPEEYQATRTALSDQHVATQVRIADEGMAVATRWMDEADSAGKAAAEHADDVPGALAQHAHRVECLSRAREAAGVARGRLEAAAALNEALMHKAGDVRISMGEKSTSDVVRDLYAIGLSTPSVYDPTTNAMQTEGEFTITSDGKNRIVTLHKAGLKRIGEAMQADPEVRDRAARSAAIRRGEHDDPAWLPEGITRRPTTTFEDRPLERRSITNALSVSSSDTPDQMAEALRLYVGACVNRGQDPMDVQSDVWSASFAEGLGLDEAGHANWRKALQEVVPHYRREKGATGRDSASAFNEHREKLRARIDGYADEYVESERKAGRMSADEAALDRQRVGVDETTRDCLYTAVLTDPRTQHALTKPGALSRDGREAVRSYAYEHLFGIDAKSEDPTEPLSKTERQAFDAWRGLKAQGDPYAVAQSELRRRAAEAPADMFGERPQADPVALVDLKDDAALLRLARANPQALGYRPIVGTNGAASYPDLQAGEAWREYDDGGNLVDHSAKTEDTIAREVRGRVRAHLRNAWMSDVISMPELAEQRFNPDNVHTAGDRWTEYVRDMGGEKRAYGAVQEMMVGDLTRRFTQAYTQRTGRSLSVVDRPMLAAQAHAAAMLAPEKRKDLSQADRAEQARLQQGKRGKFVTGTVKEKMEAAALAREEGAKLFGAEESGERAVNVHRATAGRAVEGAMRSMLPYVDASRPVEAAGNVRLSPDQQRGVRLILENKRQGINVQAGGGKSLISLAAFTQLRSEGKARRALYLVPSNVVGDFGGQFYKFADPSSGLRWFSDASASGDERRSAMADSGTHAIVMTPEALREDVTRAVAEDMGVTPQKAIGRMEGMAPEEVDHLVHSAMSKRGWDFDFLTVDEGHRTLGRQGKPDAHMARIADSVGRMAPYMVYQTADAVKNDASEVWSALNKIDPKRFSPETRDAFLRRYMRNTQASSVALQREVAPYLFATRGSIGDVTHDRSMHVLPMTEPQKGEYEKREAAYRRARAARAKGKTDVAALKALYPRAFDGTEDEHAVAERLTRALGTLREAALNEVVNLHDSGAKVDWVSQYATEHRGEPTVVFAHNRKAVRMLKARLEADGHRVGVISGDMSTDAKDKARLQFSPPAGDATADILISSDAGAMGANLQRGYHLINYDSPMTAMTHEQRIARTVRRGQQHHVSVHDLVADADYDRRARARLEDKGALRDVMTTPSEMIDDSGLMSRLEAERERAMARRIEGGARR